MPTLARTWDAHLNAKDLAMRTTVNFDPNLLQQAQALTGLSNRSELLKQALKALIEREAALRLSRLGGTAPAIQPITRRRPTDDDSC